MKYVSDKYAGKPNALIEVPKGGSFADMVALKADKEIGDKINKIIRRCKNGALHVRRIGDLGNRTNSRCCTTAP